MWHISHSTLASGNGAVVPQKAVTVPFVRTDHFMSTQIQHHPLEEYVYATFPTENVFAQKYL